MEMLSVIIRAYGTAVSQAGSRTKNSGVRSSDSRQNKKNMERSNEIHENSLAFPERHFLLLLLLKLPYLHPAMTTPFTLALLLLLASSAANAQRCASAQCVDSLFRDLYALKISRQNAAPRIRQTHEYLRNISRQQTASTSNHWVFPLRGYSPTAIGGRGAGYRGERGYDFFSGNAHGGHPAHDVFIRDKDFNDLDDRTGKPVDVLSISDGLVVSMSPLWKPDSMDAKKQQVLRGGICVWVYDPTLDGLFYYAHLRNTACHVGQLINAGDKLGEVGRTGKNAFPHRSPTHLHLMFLEFRDGVPKPLDIYPRLVQAVVVK
jgi:hypothetical protein